MTSRGCDMYRIKALDWQWCSDCEAFEHNAPFGMMSMKEIDGAWYGKVSLRVQNLTLCTKDGTAYAFKTREELETQMVGFWRNMLETQLELVQ